MLKKLIELHRQGRLDDAEQGYRAHLLEHPDDAEAHHLLGQLRHQRGEFVEAEQLVQRAHELGPDQPLILLTLGAFRSQQDDLAAARGYYQQALVLNPNLAAAHAALGHVLLAEGNGETAEQHFHMALRVGSDEHALAGLATIALDKGDTAAALRHLTRAADNGSQDASIYLLLARAFLAQGTPAFAEQALNNALRLNPDLLLARGLLAQTLLQAGRHDDAEPHYRKLAESTQYATAATIGLADIARARGEFDDAAKGYQSALASAAQPPMVIKAYAWTLTRLGRLDEAIVAYEQYLALAPNDDDARRGRAELLTVANHLVEAQAAWQELSERHPDEPTPHARLAVLSDYTGDFAAALKHAEWIEAHTPGEVESTLVRIRAALRDGNHAAAQALLDGLDQHTDLSEGAARLRLNYRGRLHDQAGEYADAARCFSEAQSRAASDLPALAEPPPQLAEVLEETPGPKWAEAPILLLGLPGSGVEQIAALLADQPDLVVLRDRIGTRLRNDDFNAPNFARYLGDIDDADL
ncbi:MAG: tetratricopeptide repeat protein, partial [Dokdonella sp.]